MTAPSTPLAPAPLITTPRASLTEPDRELVAAAEAARLKAYAPYSNFLVGAALRTLEGYIVTAANMENASYGLSLCAEAAALARCVAENGGLLVETMAVVGAPRSVAGLGPPTPPCGRCRQLLLEAAHCSGLELRVLSAFAGAPDVATLTISQLLPFGFGPLHLQAPGA